MSERKGVFTDDVRPRRIDPAGCGCTDCLTGYSVPLGCEPGGIAFGGLARAWAWTWGVPESWNVEAWDEVAHRVVQRAW